MPFPGCFDREVMVIIGYCEIRNLKKGYFGPGFEKSDPAMLIQCSPVGAPPLVTRVFVYREDIVVGPRMKLIDIDIVNCRKWYRRGRCVCPHRKTVSRLLGRLTPDDTEGAGE